MLPGQMTRTLFVTQLNRAHNVSPPRTTRLTVAAFALVRSVVESCLSFAGMIESTFTATHSSFYAIMSLVEHFGNLRNTLSAILFSIPLLRLLQSLINKLLGRPVQPFTPESFAQYESRSTQPKLSKKPLIIFLLAIFGLPYLMSKLITRLAKQSIEAEHLDPQKLEFYQALYDFTPQDVAVELSLRKGDIVAVLQKLDGGWWKARKRDGSVGFVPGNYLDIIPRRNVVQGKAA
jgi:peroxin-13